MYEVTEQSVPAGYLLDPIPQLITLEGGRTGVVRFQNDPRPRLRILKVDVVTGDPLPLAEFRVSKVEGSTVSEYITDESGTIIVENLDEAIYKVEEFMPPDGYIRYDITKEIMMEAGTTKTLKFDNVRKPTLIVTKTDGLSFEPIPNTTYKIEREDASGGIHLLGTFRTDENGQIVIPKAEAGWYIITETVPAPGYSLSSNPVTRKYLSPGENAYTSFTANGTGGDISGENVMVTYGGEYLLGEEIINYPLNSIVIRKADANTGELLAGAAFEVRRVTGDISGGSGTIIGRYTTDNSGTIVITGLVPGGYIIEEVEAPANYLLSENSMQQVWLKSDGTSIVETTFANWPYGAILVTKVDTQTNKPLPNARFKVTDSSGAVVGSTNGEYVTDASGEILIPNIKPGSYVITELEAPENYVIDTTPQTIEVGLDGKVYTVAFKNQPSATLTILKLDSATREPLSGAEFTVTDSAGAVVGTGNGKFTTDETGQIVIPNLPKGSYIVKESRAPDGYILENQQQTIAVDYGKTYTLEFFNKKMSGLQIIKIDSVTKQPLKDAEFTVYKQSGDIVDRYTTDKDGVIIIETLTPGWYKVVETKTLDGYVLDDTPKDVQITDNQFVKLVFENAPMSDLIIRKVDADTRVPLEGAEFTVRKSDEQLIGVYRSGTDGVARVGILAPGLYSVTETKAPEGYTLGNNVQTVQITNSKTVTLEFENRPFGSLVLKKIDEINGAPLSGATFEVHKQGGGFVGEYTTDATGTVTILSVEPGWYIVSEKKAPTGYTLDSTAKTVEVKSGVPSITTFTNKPLSGIQILKLDADTKAPLSGAVFMVERPNGERVGDNNGKHTTDEAGKILLSDLTEGIYIISEIEAPVEYVLDAQPQTVEVKSGRLTIAEFVNRPYPYLRIVKTDASTGELLSGAEFVVTNSKGDIIANVTSQSSGAVSIKVAPGVYTITETKPPSGYELNDPVQTVEVLASGGVVYYGTTTAYPGNSANFANRPLNTLQIIKLDSITHNPLSNAIFKVEKINGGSIGTFRTDADGSILLSGLTEGSYVISEIAAPTGYILSESPKTVNLSDGKLVDVMFLNKPLSGIQIVKLDAVTHQPLQGASFTVTKANGERIGTFKTETDGKVLVPDLDEGVYVVGETAAPDGYQLDESPKNVTVKSGVLATVEFSNKPLSGIEIIKLDSVTKAPLSGASFQIERDNGEKIGTYKTDTAGKIIVSDLTEGTYIVSETSAPDGYLLDAQPQTVVVKSGKLTAAEFLNKPLSRLQITKTNSVTGEPLPGAVFKVTDSVGAVIGTSGGEYTTDSNGQILIKELKPGAYTVTEIKCPDGYVMDSSPKTIEVKDGKLFTLEFTNTPMGGLQIKKLDSVTKKPLQGAVFRVTDSSGTIIGTTNGEFKTDSNGLIYIPNLKPGAYIVTETSCPDGYIMDSEPKTIEIKDEKMYTLEFTNTPIGGFQLLKLDEETKKAIANVEFTISKMNGERVGTYTTDSNGIIRIPNLESGWYNAVETKAATGYALDTAAHSFEMKDGQTTAITVTNRKTSAILIRKIDAVTGKGIYGVKFLISDENNNPLKTVISDQDGYVYTTGLTDGKYYVREIEAAQGYIIDNQTKTFYVLYGSTTEIIWKNTPVMGQFQITKKSADDNPINGFPKGTLLQGAVFEIYDRASNLVDTITSDKNGLAVSKTLPLGRYTIREVKAPTYYSAPQDSISAEIEFSGQIVRLEVLNSSVYTNVSISKKGYTEVVPGQQIRYDFKNIGNNSTVALDSFYWRDTLPTDAVRLGKIITGTWTHQLSYKIVFKTNINDTYRTLADNLSTSKNYTIDASPAALGLAANEAVTEFMVVFGRVPAGFKQLEAPYIYCDVVKGLAHEYRFTNKCDVGGLWGNQWIMANDRWVTVVYSNAAPVKLPRTGY